MTKKRVFLNGPIFDGTALRSDAVAVFHDDVFVGLCGNDAAGDGDRTDLKGDILSTGYVDLQVNGGDGVMLNEAPSAATLKRMAGVHRGLGATRILPTLITDTREVTQAAISAAKDAIRKGVAGIAGLHLEGPHLSVARKGAHDAALIRPMEEDDLVALAEAKASLPVLMVTIAPENVTCEQVKRLSEAGIIVALGHTDADYETCLAYAEAGARMVTHLFNAMSQLGNRHPGLVGAALDCGSLSAGLIADGVHVHPASMKAAWHAKQGPGQIVLVSDSMAVAGTGDSEFMLGDRRILREYGRLTLDDGTLAGADLDLTSAIRTLVHQAGIPLEAALQAATSAPARVIGLDATLEPGKTHLSDMIRIAPDLSRVEPLQL